MICASASTVVALGKTPVSPSSGRVNGVTAPKGLTTLIHLELMFLEHRRLRGTHVLAGHTPAGLDAQHSPRRSAWWRGHPSFALTSRRSTTGL